MTPLSVPLAALGLVLAVAGAAKLWRPGDTARALGAVASRRVPPGLVRGIAACELALGLLTLSVGGRLVTSLVASLVAASYAGFAVFVAIALVTDAPIATCGCFGEPDTPPTVAHLVTCAAGAALAAWAAAEPPAPLLSSVAHHPTDAFGLVVLTCALAYAAGLVMSATGRVVAARRELGLELGGELGAEPEPEHGAEHGAQLEPEVWP